MTNVTTEHGIPTKDGLYSWIPEDVYHCDRGSLSVSGAKLLLPPSCPAKFRSHMDNLQPPNRNFEFGHLAHLEILGKGVETVEIDADSYRTKDARDARDKARANGKVPVLTGKADEVLAELGKARLMARKVFNHPVAGPLMTDPKNEAEMALYANDPATGVRLRGRIDAMHFGADGTITLIDVKTSNTANPAELVRKFYSLNYFMQAAWYRDLMTALKLATDPDFLFVVVEKEPPHVVSVVRYDEAAIEEGRRLNRVAVDLYAQCRERDEWPAYCDDHIVPLSLPSWVTRSQVQADAADLIAELEALADNN